MSGGRRERTVCRLEDLPEGGTRGFAIEGAEGRQEIFLLRRGSEVLGYVNSCPHVGSPLDWVPDRFLAPDGRHFLCATHGALFRIEDGYCVSGPCAGAALTPVALRVEDDAVIIEA